MTKPIRLKKSTIDWNTEAFSHAVMRHFESAYLNDPSGQQTPDAYFEQHLFFITVSFRQRTLWYLAPHRATQLTEFAKLHFEISRYLHGHNLNRKRKRQPLTYAFVDFEGSRQGQSDALSSVTPHVHALMLVAPKDLQQFHSAVSEPQLRAWVPSIKEIKVESYVAQEGTVETLVSYCMKGVAQTSSAISNREDLWGIFPK